MKTPPAARWSGGVIALHWLSAGWLALVFALGLAATAGDFDAARKFDLYQTHKALGWLTLVLLAARLAARAAREAGESKDGEDGGQAESRPRRSRRPLARAPHDEGRWSQATPDKRSALS